jgi:glycosyltransferase involved in cell wall biosynthesis
MNIINYLKILIFCIICCKADNKRFIVFIPSYNNEQWCIKNLESALFQDYENFKIIYINDKSTDKTQKIVENFIKKNDLEDKIILKNNHERIGKCKNMWKTLHNLNDLDFEIKDDDIIVPLDGDDWWANKYVLSYLNNIYNKEEIWTTYGGYVTWPDPCTDDTLKIPDFVLKQNLLRVYSRYTTQQRSFYCWLYRQIKLEDFFQDNNFFAASNDVAKMTPICEMSSKNNRIKQIGYPIYIYNRANCINDDKVNAEIQIKIDEKIRSKTPYNPLDCQPKDNFLKNSFISFSARDKSVFTLLDEINEKYIIFENDHLFNKNEDIDLIISLMEKAQVDIFISLKANKKYNKYPIIYKNIRACQTILSILNDEFNYKIFSKKLLNNYNCSSLSEFEQILSKELVNNYDKICFLK